MNNDEYPITCDAIRNSIKSSKVRQYEKLCPGQAAITLLPIFVPRPSVVRSDICYQKLCAMWLDEISVLVQVQLYDYTDLQFQVQKQSHHVFTTISDTLTMIPVEPLN